MGTRIGRVLVASLHQAIADVIPTRLEFYECGAARSSVGAGARDGRKARLGFGALKARRRRAMAMAQRHFDFAASSKGRLGLDVHD